MVITVTDYQSLVCGSPSDAILPLLSLLPLEVGVFMKNARASFLFACPSPAAGMARFFDFAGVFDAYNVSTSEDEADAMATQVDWACIGDSFQTALTKALPK